MGSPHLSQILPRKMKAVLVLSIVIAQAFGLAAECNPPMPSECAEGDISCDMGTHADCWLGDVCMPEGSTCPPSCNTPAPSVCYPPLPSECGETDISCDMGTHDGCWLGDF